MLVGGATTSFYLLRAVAHYESRFGDGTSHASHCCLSVRSELNVLQLTETCRYSFDGVIEHIGMNTEVCMCITHTCGNHADVGAVCMLVCVCETTCTDHG